MRLSAYLCTSRHGIFYFRFPLPVSMHPEMRRRHVKLSLHTREPRRAAFLARQLWVTGQSLIGTPMLAAMRYDDMRRHVREHFAQLLIKFRETTAEHGPVDEVRRHSMEGSIAFSHDSVSDWLDLMQSGDPETFVRAFCELRGIPDVPTGKQAAQLAAEIQKGHRAYLFKALEYSASFGELSLDPEDDPLSITVPAIEPLTADKSAPATKIDSTPLNTVLDAYFAELDRTKALAAKTDGEKRDALDLMAQLTSNMPPADMTKADARAIKAALLKLPKNRSKNPKTRDLSLNQQLEVVGVERIVGRTLNVYLGHMRHFFGWACDNGYVAENVFLGLRLKSTARSVDTGRTAFSADQLQRMFAQLTDPDSPLVRKTSHKWPALIGMFTGMRLNEIAQLEIKDIAQIEDVWCFDVNKDGDPNKSLKNAQSARRVPIHQKLIELGFLDFFEAQKADRKVRLFPDLSYSKQNGYGRNIGRWFNESFLPALGLGEQGLVFHCLRHTMITRLAQADVEEAMIKAISGHSQSGVTFTTYLRQGFLLTQLRDAIHRFNF